MGAGRFHRAADSRQRKPLLTSELLQFCGGLLGRKNLGNHGNATDHRRWMAMSHSLTIRIARIFGSPRVLLNNCVEMRTAAISLERSGTTRHVRRVWLVLRYPPP